MNKKHWKTILGVGILCVTVVGIASAAPAEILTTFKGQSNVITAANAAPSATITQEPQYLTPVEKANIIAEACWQANNAELVPLLQNAGLERQDIQEAEKLWAQKIMQQYPDLTLETAAPMHLSWALGYLQQSKAAATANVINTAIPQDSTPQVQPTTPPAPPVYQNTPQGHGNHPGHTGQNCNWVPGSNSANGGYYGGCGSGGGHH